MGWDAEMAAGNQMAYGDEDSTVPPFHMMHVGVGRRAIAAIVGAGSYAVANEATNPIDPIDPIRQKLSDEYETAAARMTELRKRLDAIDRLPAEEVAQDGDLITFSITFPRTSGQIYSYSGIKANGLYYLSGTKNQGSQKTWAELLAFIGYKLVGDFGVYRREPGGAMTLVTAGAEDANPPSGDIRYAEKY